ncbi:MAG: LysM peptidoglycan-binding domain-containing protein [Candidatus Moraniibacteriota bacterium]|nr:MAG: LysM peptidoglycan-binding domain-containing protein [Candidatus Moranbacteria bacterium]
MSRFKGSSSVGSGRSNPSSSKFKKPLVDNLKYLRSEFASFLLFLSSYTKDKVFFFSNIFEKNKNTVVKSILIKRGKRNRFFLHVSAMAVLSFGVLISPFITENNPFSENENLLSFAQDITDQPQSLAPQDVFHTQLSEKPRSEIISYTVQKGDTLSGIAKKFGISEDTIKWRNSLRADTITVGDTLEVLPVTGVAHKVASGDTIYSIAKKYSSNPQSIVDFPFNDFADPQTFSLVIGQNIIVPEGVQPEAAPIYVARRTLIATGPVTISGAGFTWPIHGTMNQYYSWYHRAVDLGAPVGTPIVAAHSGTVSEAIAGGWNYGYGTHVIISGDNGYQTLYAHMSALGVSSGQRVVAGSTIVGWVGMTGRTTGPHLHFEIRSGGGFLNPLSFLH